MAWESRWNKRYYYRVRRVGNRVIKTYMGRGPSAQAAAQEDREKRAARAIQRHVAELEKAMEQPAKDVMAELNGQVNIVIQTALAVAGYRQHDRGKWRKRRAKANDAEQ